MITKSDQNKRRKRYIGCLAPLTDTTHDFKKYIKSTDFIIDTDTNYDATGVGWKPHANTLYPHYMNFVSKSCGDDYQWINGILTKNTYVSEKGTLSYTDGTLFVSENVQPQWILGLKKDSLRNNDPKLELYNQKLTDIPTNINLTNGMTLSASPTDGLDFNHADPTKNLSLRTGENGAIIVNPDFDLSTHKPVPLHTTPSLNKDYRIYCKIRNKSSIPTDINHIEHMNSIGCFIYDKRLSVESSSGTNTWKQVQGRNELFFIVDYGVQTLAPVIESARSWGGGKLNNQKVNINLLFSPTVHGDPATQSTPASHAVSKLTDVTLAGNGTETCVTYWTFVEKLKIESDDPIHMVKSDVTMEYEKKPWISGDYKVKQRWTDMHLANIINDSNKNNSISKIEKSISPSGSGSGFKHPVNPNISKLTARKRSGDWLQIWWAANFADLYYKPGIRDIYIQSCNFTHWDTDALCEPEFPTCDGVDDNAKKKWYKQRIWLVTGDYPCMCWAIYNKVNVFFITTTVPNPRYYCIYIQDF